MSGENLEVLECGKQTQKSVTQEAELKLSLTEGVKEGKGKFVVSNEERRSSTSNLDDPCDSGGSHGRSGPNPPYGASSGWVGYPSMTRAGSSDDPTESTSTQEGIGRSRSVEYLGIDVRDQTKKLGVKEKEEMCTEDKYYKKDKRIQQGLHKVRHQQSSAKESGTWKSWGSEASGMAPTQREVLRRQRPVPRERDPQSRSLCSGRFTTMRSSANWHLQQRTSVRKQFGRGTLTTI